MGVEPAMTLEIAGRPIGPGHPCFVIAEAGVNHDGDVALAQQLVDAAAAAGADAVKFQTFRADQVASRQAAKAAYQVETTGGHESQYEMLKRLELPLEALPGLQRRCRDRHILFLSTPFDEASVDFLDSLGVPAFKVGSGELTNLPFLRHIAGKGRPVILSTGMGTMAEVEDGYRAVVDSGNPQIALLHCVSRYPAEPREVNLRAMASMAEAFGVPIGYSDHTLGLEVPLAAVALGATILEKHFTLDKGRPGPDHRSSLGPDELKALVQGVRTVEAALGSGRKEPAPGEAETARAARRSLVAARAIPAGTLLTDDLIAVRRPGTGLPPIMRERVLGRKTRKALMEGEPLTLEALA